jgi:hypothetical protein
MPHVYCRHKIYLRYEDVFICINITKNYQCKLIEDTKSRMNHDSDCRIINKDLAALNHTS